MAVPTTWPCDLSPDWILEVKVVGTRDGDQMI
jgi:hypothetical protein